MRRRRGLVGTMARTAVIAGTATATAGAVSGHQQKKAAQKQQQAALEAQAQQADLQAQIAAQQAAAAPPPPPPAAAPAGAGDVTAQLQKLAELKAAGVLDEAEFTAAKAKILMS